MGKKSKKGQSRATQHHGKAKRATQKRQNSNRYRSSDDREKTVETAQSVESTPSPTHAATVTPPPPIVDDAKPPAVATETPLEQNLSLLTPSQQTLAQSLVSMGQSHLFSKWSPPGTNDSMKVELLEKLERMDDAYPSNGLVGYLTNAKSLLEKSRKGDNPLEGWVPSVPQGELFDMGSKDFWDCESIGLKEIGKCGFALVAGGLGERLGYSGIKVCALFQERLVAKQCIAGGLHIPFFPPYSLAFLRSWPPKHVIFSSTLKPSWLFNRVMQPLEPSSLSVSWSPMIRMRGLSNSWNQITTLE